MLRGSVYRTVFLLHIVLLYVASPALSLTAEEVIKENEKRSTVESFRVGVDITHMKAGKVTSTHYLWIIGATDQGGTSLFVEFDAPEEAKGMRFLFRFPARGSSAPPKAFAYMPATDATVSMKPGDSSDIGATGMTVEDFRGFVPAPQGELRLLADEKVGSRECYVIAVYDSGGTQTDKIWISKDQFLLVKSQRLDPQGNIQREFSVLEFFTTEQGKMWPRKEELLVPKDRVRIIVEQQTGIYNLDIPEELLNPGTFGTFQWQTPGS